MKCVLDAVLFAEIRALGDGEANDAVAVGLPSTSPESRSSSMASSDVSRSAAIRGLRNIRGETSSNMASFVFACARDIAVV